MKITLLFFFKEGSKDCERVKGILREFPRQLVLHMNVENESTLSAIDRYNICMVPTVVALQSGRKICGKNITRESVSDLLL